MDDPSHILPLDKKFNIREDDINIYGIRIDTFNLC